jgi:hypothetical protein
MFAKKSISRIFSVLFVIVFILAVTPLQAAHAAGVRYAKPIASGTGDCSSWANACTLRTALTGAVSGDEIWAAAGTYKPTTGIDRNATFQLKDGVALYGGFAGTETAIDQRNPTLNATTLSGDLLGNDNSIMKYDEPTRADNSYHVVTGSAGATLDGFTITAGNATGISPNWGGGGMYNASGSNPTLTQVTFSGNSAMFGGGMGNYDSSSPTLTNVTFTNNSAIQGGGMYNGTSSPALTNVTFSGNSAHYDGGGMMNYHSSPTLTNVTFSGNTTNGDSLDDGGGGMFNSTSNPTLMNVTFSGNNGDWLGGGMFNHYSSPMMTNVTFSGNTAYGGGGMFNKDGYSNMNMTNVTFSGNSAQYGGGMFNDISNASVRNTIFWGNTAPIAGAQVYITNYAEQYPFFDDNVIEGGCPTGGFCIYTFTDDPVLGTLGNYGGFTQTIPLLAGSSAIDAGNDAMCADTDQRGVTRPQGAHCDIGAYELDTTTPDTQIDTHPANPSNSADASFTFSSADGTATFECSLEGFAYAACTSSKNYTGLAAGSHSFAVRAKDPAGNVDATPASSTWVIDLTAPTVVSSLRANTSPTNAAIVDFTLTFSEDVTGVAASDFALTKTGTISGASVTGVSGGPIIYTVSVSTGSGNGTITLDVPVSAIITDLAGNPLVSLPYTGGETYTISKVFTIFLPLILR